MSETSLVPIRKHRRDLWLRIFLPVLLPFVLLLALLVALTVAVATNSMEFVQVRTMMGLLATIFIACPMALLCMISTLLLVGLSIGSGLAYRHVRTPLRGVRAFSERVARQTDELAPKVAAPFTRLPLWIEKWEHVFKRLPAGEDDNQSKEDTNDQ